MTAPRPRGCPARDGAGVRQAPSAPSALDAFSTGGDIAEWSPAPPAALKVGSIHVSYAYKTKELTRLKAKLNKLKMNDASGIFPHTLLFDRGHLNR